MPPLYKDGVMIVGDAAMLVNNVHWEGTNLAMMSGKFAAETAIQAIDKNDSSANMLSLYRKKLDESYVMKDLKSYKDVMGVLEGNAKTLLGFYPSKINEFMNQFTTVDGIPKKIKYQRFIGDVIKQRSIPKMMFDGIKLANLAGGILLK